MRRIVRDYYSKIPNELILCTKEKSSLTKDIDDRVILIWNYIYTNTNRKGILKFTIDDMVSECGFKPDKHKGKINDKFKDILLLLQEQNIISNLEFIKGLHTLKPKEIDSCYFELYQWELDKILKEKDKISLLKIYCCLKARMYKREEGKEFTTYGEAETCFSSYNDISLCTGVSESKIKTYIDKLVKMDLIRYKNAGIKVDIKSGSYEYCRNTYALYKDGWENEINLTIAIYKNTNKDKYKFIPYDAEMDKRQLGGEKGYLIKKQSEGKLTKKEKLKLNEIEIKLKAK